MAIVVVEKNGGSGTGSGSSPLKITVMIDNAHGLPNGQVRDGAIVSLAGSWTDPRVQSAQWDVSGPSGAISLASLTCEVSWKAKTCAQFTAVTPGSYKVKLHATLDGNPVMNEAGFNVVAISTLQNATGKLVMLRAHEQGSKFGPPSDELDVEVVFKLESKPDLAFGFQLRDDAGGPAHRAMYDLLRDAYAHDWAVTIDYSIVDLKHNGVVSRIWLQK